ncbi:histone-lysine N-methyltransferase SETMAR [Trichonephila clavipes]|nr:histone-lysine N-methyltransferase SETMAR [Trichonephila clavipes]
MRATIAFTPHGLPNYLLAVMDPLQVTIEPYAAVRCHHSARQYKASPISKVCVEALARKKWEVLEHLTYNPDLSPCEYDIFLQLEKSLMVQRFHSNDDVKAAVLNWFYDQPTSFFVDGIRKIPKQW